MSVTVGEGTGVHITAIHVKYGGDGVQTHNNNSKAVVQAPNGELTDGAVRHSVTHTSHSSSVHVVQTAEHVSRVSEPMPQTSEPMPQTSEPMPQTSEPMPQTLEQVPQTLEQVPQTWEQVPQPAEEVPQAIEQTSPISEPLPAAARQDVSTVNTAVRPPEAMPTSGGDTHNMTEMDTPVQVFSGHSEEDLTLKKAPLIEETAVDALVPGQGSPVETTADSSDKEKLVENVPGGNHGNGKDPTTIQGEDTASEKDKGVRKDIETDLDEVVLNGATEVDLDAIDVQELAAASSLWTTRRDGAVTLRLAKNGPGSETPYTVPALVMKTVQQIPDGVALAVKREGTWVKWTYSQYLADIRRAAKSFIKLGLEPYRGVGIIGFNSPEWFIADLGCIFAGGLTTGIYTTNSPEACRYVAASSGANVLVVENQQQLKKILEVRHNLPDLKAIVQYTGQVDPSRASDVLSWAQFMEVGNDVPDSVLDERIKAQSPNKCCMLIYTSGTTGNPKGVMLSHDNITWTLGSLKSEASRQLPFRFGELCMVSYLPLSHIAAQLLDIYIVMSYGGTTYFAQPDALKGSLVDTLREVQPHLFLGVPRVWEKFQERMQTAALSITGIKRRISRWAKGVGLKGNYAIMNGQSPSFTMAIADKILFKKVRTLLGMERCEMRLSGAAPITKETLEYFMGVNQTLCEVYGMSECTGPHTNTFPKVNRVGSVGKELPGISTVLANPDEDGNGEVVMHGRHVFMGYLDDEEKSREAIDDDGGLHSGDIGRKDKDGFLYITGRIKELIITAGGENVAPVPIEDAVKEAVPIISQCMLVGDKRRFLSMVITFKVEVNVDTQEPTDTLTAVAQAWVKEVGSTATTVSAVIEPGDRAVLQAVQRGIDRVNSRAVSNAQKIQKWSLLPKDFSIPGGELGPTMKLKRPVIHQMYFKTIDAFYEEKPAAAAAEVPASASADPAAPASDGATNAADVAPASDGAASAADVAPPSPAAEST